MDGSAAVRGRMEKTLEMGTPERLDQIKGMGSERKIQRRGDPRVTLYEEVSQREVPMLLAGAAL